MDEYLKNVLLQIRCKKVHPYIAEELKSHIDDQIDENIKAGMSQEQAELEAIRDMGDPIEVGVAMDGVHRPQIAWKLLLLIAMVSVASIIIHQIICSQMANYEKINVQINEMSRNYFGTVLLGLFMMFFIYFIDYTVIGKYARTIAILFIGINLIAIFNGTMMNGMINSFEIGNLKGSIFAVMMLYIPVFGAVIYKYHGNGYVGVIKSIVWMTVPVFLALRLPNIILAGILLVSMLVQLTLAIVNDWYFVSKRKTVIALWMSAFCIPFTCLMGMYLLHFLAAYQEARIKAIFQKSGNAYYMESILDPFLESYKFVGSSGKDLISELPNFNSDFIFTYLVSSYGLLAGILICCILAAIILIIFGASIRQKNQLGMVMGCGCGMIFLINFVMNISENLGWFPITQTFLPFFSAGGSNMILSYTLIGIILSIYRYKNVYPKHKKDLKSKVDITIGSC